MYRRAAGYAFAGLPAVAAASTWLELPVQPNLSHLASAGEATAIAFGFRLFGWWGLLRVRLELTTDGIVKVNKFAPHKCSTTMGSRSRCAL